MARVLIVDDNETSRRVLLALLSGEGHEASAARDGMHGLELAHEQRPELIISDVLMPGMDGFEFVRRLRAQGSQLATTPVIFHTAHFLDPQAQELARVCNVSRVLPKPCDPSHLLATVADALDQNVTNDLSAITASFSVEHLRLLTDKLAANVMELQSEVEARKKAQQRILQLNRVHAVLSGINSLIVRLATREELCREACKLAISEGQFKIAWIGLKDPEAGRIVPFAWAGEIPELLAFTQISAAGTPTGDDAVSQALASKLPVVCNDLRAVATTVLCGENLLTDRQQALVVLPLVVADTAVGCLMLVSEVSGFFDEAEMRLLSELAGDIAFALDHIEKAETLDHLAFYDSLTGLANRRLFLDRLGQKMEAATRRKTGLALVIMDIARLEAVNESFGRHIGDQLLRQAAERFSLCVGNPKDVARIGSDHLATVIEDVTHDDGVIRAIEDWSGKWLGKPFLVQGHEITLSAKAGVAVYPQDGADATTLLHHGETALKKAKHSSEHYAFYSQHLSEARTRRLAMENKLRRALEREEFMLYYQPKVDLKNRHIVGVEALLRWNSPELGSVSPAQFVPLLEDMGRIIEVGTWVLHQACLDRGTWLERGLRAPRIAVNVSAAQLERADFVRTFSKSVGDVSGIDLEITESLMMSEVEANIEKLTALRALGVHIAIDDFGTGYSSLAYLAKLPVQTLKIDRSFVSGMADDPDARTLVATIISLAHALRLNVVAEGVETEEQAKMLCALCCDQMQGYLITPALPFEDMSHLLSPL